MSAAEGRKRRSRGHWRSMGKRARAGPRGGAGPGLGAGPSKLEPGMRGVLITCNMEERKCVAEAYSLLGEYADGLYGPETFADPDQDQLSGNEEEDDDDDAEAALKKEVAQIRASTEQRQRRFQSVESGANNVVFIRTLGVEPEELVHHILKDMHVTKKKKTRVILRMLPVSGTCKAFLEDMKRFSETFFQPWFKSPQKGTFKIVYKARNNGSLDRKDVIKELAGVVGQLNAENKVDLSDPEFTIVVEVIKKICCLSVVKDYVLFRKYNLQEVVKGSKEEGQQVASNQGNAGSANGAKVSEMVTGSEDKNKEMAEAEAETEN